MSEHQVIPPPKPQRGMIIHGLVPRLPERGKVKIGGLSPQKRQAQGGGREWQPPIKYDHFVITTMRRGQDGNFERDEEMHRRFGEQPTLIPVRLLFDDPTLNFPTRLACYKGRSLWCSGDGQKALRMNDQHQRAEVPCPCPLSDPTIERKANELRCKMNGSLSMLIDGASGLGGVWRFRTTSYNTITGLLSTMSFLRQVTGGPLANVPLLLKIQPQQGSNPVTGETVLIYVVGLEFDGTVEELQHYGHSVALHRAQTHLAIEHIEEEARRNLLLSAPVDAPLPGDDDKIVDEFYPEQADADGGDTPPRPRREDYEPDNQKGESEAADQAHHPAQESAQPEPARQTRRTQRTALPKDEGQHLAVGDGAGERTAAAAPQVADPLPPSAAGSTQEPSDTGDEKPFAFGDQFGEVQEFATLDAALAHLEELLSAAPDMKALEALIENGAVLAHSAGDQQLGPIRKAYQARKSILNQKPTAPPADDPIDASLRSCKSVREFQAKWLKLLDPDRDRLRQRRPEYERLALAAEKAARG